MQSDLLEWFSNKSDKIMLQACGVDFLLSIFVIPQLLLRNVRKCIFQNII